MRKSLTGLFAAGLLLCATAGANAFPTYMDMTNATKPDVKPFAKNSQWIEVQSLTWAGTNGKAAGTNIGSQSTGAGAGRVTGDSVKITLRDGAAQEQLFKASASGQHLSTVRIVMTKTVKGAETPVYLITLSNVAVASQKWTMTAKDVPVDSVDLVYQSVEMELAQNESAPMTNPPAGGWNRVKNVLAGASPSPSPAPGGWNRVKNVTAVASPSPAPGSWNRVTNKYTPETLPPTP